ncbi:MULTISPECIES: hypothetical protein [Haloarcula]|uniref:Uncharacterized protein n=2 Tax=Haloarcula TaxID=2237 RepID=A0ACC6VRV0_9EURY|nr:MULTISPECIES: hypothetical protein [Haloarcula]EMA31497.1 hypothetical protein C444_07880 [Haloarcula japonica DSM 6131]
MSLSSDIDRDTLVEINGILLLLNTIGLVINTKVILAIPFTLGLFLLSIKYVRGDRFYRKLESEGIIPKKNHYAVILARLSPFDLFVNQLVDEIERQRRLMCDALSHNKELRIKTARNELEQILGNYGINLSTEEQETLEDLLREEWASVREE